MPKPNYFLRLDIHARSLDDKRKKILQHWRVENRKIDGVDTEFDTFAALAEQIEKAYKDKNFELVESLSRFFNAAIQEGDIAHAAQNNRRNIQNSVEKCNEAINGITSDCKTQLLRNKIEEFKKLPNRNSKKDELIDRLFDTVDIPENHNLIEYFLSQMTATQENEVVNALIEHYEGVPDEKLINVMKLIKALEDDDEFSRKPNDREMNLLYLMTKDDEGLSLIAAKKYHDWSGSWGFTSDQAKWLKSGIEAADKNAIALDQLLGKTGGAGDGSSGSIRSEEQTIYNDPVERIYIKLFENGPFELEDLFKKDYSRRYEDLLKYALEKINIVDEEAEKFIRSDDYTKDPVLMTKIKAGLELKKFEDILRKCGGYDSMKHSVDDYERREFDQKKFKDKIKEAGFTSEQITEFAKGIERMTNERDKVGIPALRDKVLRCAYEALRNPNTNASKTPPTAPPAPPPPVPDPILTLTQDDPSNTPKKRRDSLGKAQIFKSTLESVVDIGTDEFVEQLATYIHGSEDLNGNISNGIIQINEAETYQQNIFISILVKKCHEKGRGDCRTVANMLLNSSSFGYRERLATAWLEYGKGGKQYVSRNLSFFGNRYEITRKAEYIMRNANKETTRKKTGP